MKNLVIVAALVLHLGVFVFPQPDSEVSLIVKHCDAGEGICDTQHLIRYDFENGRLARSERILTVETLDVRFDLGQNRIYRNRYVISHWGDVFDIETRKILHRGDGEVVALNGDEVIIKIDKLNLEGVFSYNLVTGKYGKIDGKRYREPGLVSPDGRFSAMHIDDGTGIEIREIATRSKKFVKGQFLVGLSSSANEFAKLPLLWLDSQRILTQRDNGELVLVTTKGVVTPVVKIKIDESPYVSPRLYLDSDNQIIYDCVSKFVIDVERQKFSAYKKIPLGNGFSLMDDDTVQTEWGTGNVFFFENSEIGRVWSTGSSTTKGSLAVLYGKIGTNLGYPDGIKVWSEKSREWTTIELKWSPRIIGWVTK